MTYVLVKFKFVDSNVSYNQMVWEFMGVVLAPEKRGPLLDGWRKLRQLKILESDGFVVKATLSRLLGNGELLQVVSILLLQSSFLLLNLTMNLTMNLF